MFLELICAAYERQHCLDDTISTSSHEKSPASLEECSIQQQSSFTIRITVYHAQQMDYPQTSQEWDSYDGIIIPGSRSTAYHTHIDWIHRLMTVIQQEIHEKQRKTLGVCFGHQCFAHSFGYQERESTDQENGLATKSSVGPIVGMKSFQLTDEGKFLFGKISPSCGGNIIPPQQEERDEVPPQECLGMLYTRGDMVKSLPSVGITLCGNSDLPNEACAYFASDEHVLQFQNRATQQDNGNDRLALGENTISQEDMLDNTNIVLPYAITFQAHPEYITNKVKYGNTVKAMEKAGNFSPEVSEKACEDARLHHEMLESDSLDATVSAGRILGWF